MLSPYLGPRPGFERRSGGLGSRQAGVVVNPGLFQASNRAGTCEATMANSDFRSLVVVEGTLMPGRGEDSTV